MSVTHVAPTTIATPDERLDSARVSWALSDIRHAIERGKITGFTISAKTGADITGGVSVGGHPSCPEVRIKITGSGPLNHALHMYAELVRAWGGGVMGGWVHEGYLYLDAPTIVGDRTTGEMLGRERGELAIFDLDTQTTITL